MPGIRDREELVLLKPETWNLKPSWGDTMGTATGFMEYSRKENPFRDVKERLSDYEDLHVAQPAEERFCQASRCMNCGVPFCQSGFGCPLHNLIPEWNDLLCRGQEQEALERLLETAPFPEFTGRVCPALCEKACNLSEEGGVTNRDNELYLIEKGFEQGWVRPRTPKTRTGKHVAVVGSGPSGLAAADLLNRLGHQVTVYERADRAGGLLTYGIPNMKLPKGIVERRIHLMEAEGITFRLNTDADPEKLGNADAVVLCGGARKPRSLNVENADAKGVYFAVDFLTETTKRLLAGEDNRLACGKHVLVIGGGDTGNDCVGTVLRQGCASVTQLEMMPAPPEFRTPGNPWPEWPRTLRTDYGQMEAAEVQGNDPRVYETTVKRVIIDAGGQMTAAETVKLHRTPDGKMAPVEGSEQTLPCDLMLIAAGFVGCDEKTREAFSLSADSRGRLLPEDQSHYLGGKLFSAGDMRTGQSLVVRALADGRAAARETDRYLRK